MIVLGIDTGFASVGLAAIELAPTSEQLLRAWVVRTELSSRKLQVRSQDDTARRAREIAAELEIAIARYIPDAIAIESPSWPRHAGVAAKLGVAFGVVFGAVERHGLPLLMASPQDVKRAVCGSKTASKSDVCLAVERRFPNIEWPKQSTLWEHAADAAGVVVACLDTDVVRALRRAAA